MTQLQHAEQENYTDAFLPEDILARYDLNGIIALHARMSQQEMQAASLLHMQDVLRRIRTQLKFIVSAVRNWRARHGACAHPVQQRYSAYEGALCEHDLRRHWALYRHAMAEWKDLRHMQQ